MARAETTPEVSVLIACWNAASGIERAIASALGPPQTDLDLEVVVVDDGSTDGTADRVAALAARDSRVRLLALSSNVGVSEARNRGLEIVRGQWLTLLDADDRFSPTGVQRLVEVARGGEVRAVIGQQIWVDGERRWWTALYDIPDIRQPGRKTIASHPGLMYFASPHAKLFERTLVDGLRFEGRVGGDQAWVIRALLRAGPIEVLDDVVYEWHRSVTPARGLSITAEARSGAAKSAEAAAVAVRAYFAVEAEAAQILVPPEAERVATVYAERLMRSDLGQHLDRALGRRDPAIAELFRAIEQFLDALPDRRFVASRALARSILEPPIRRWSEVPASGRPAYWSLLDRVGAIAPEVWRAEPDPLLRLVLRLALDPRLARRAVALLIARGAKLAVRLARLVRRGRRLPNPMLGFGRDR